MGLRPGPDSPGHKAWFCHRLDDKAKSSFPPTGSASGTHPPPLGFVSSSESSASVPRDKPLGLERVYHANWTLLLRPSLSPSETGSSEYDGAGVTGAVTGAVTRLSWLFGPFGDHIASRCSELTINTGLCPGVQGSQDGLWGTEWLAPAYARYLPGIPSMLQGLGHNKVRDLNMGRCPWNLASYRLSVRARIYCLTACKNELPHQVGSVAKQDYCNPSVFCRVSYST